VAGEIGALVRAWHDCRECPLHLHRKNVVFGRPWRAEDCRPDEDPLVLVIGESPGRVEDETGAPWSGASEPVIMRYLRDAGIRQAWLADAVACRVLAGASPALAEVRKCAGHLTALEPLLPFKGVLLVGRFALEMMDAGVWPDFRSLPRLFVPHPNALLVNGWPHNADAIKKCDEAVEAVRVWRQRLGDAGPAPVEGPAGAEEAPAVECAHEWIQVGQWQGPRSGDRPIMACTRCAVIQKPALDRAPRKAKEVAA
jgi:uracil-DNA glycosylase family 4